MRIFALENRKTSQKRMEMHNFVTIANLSKDKIMYLIQMAQEFEKHPNRELLKGKVVATLFFEPSTRTRLSFETAANRLGARVFIKTLEQITHTVFINALCVMAHRNRVIPILFSVL